MGDRFALADGGRESQISDQGARLARYLERIGEGDALASEELLAAYAPFAMSVASRVVGRFVRLGHDDEANIALLALDEATRAFAPDKGNFLGFASQVIRRRLIDNLRHEGRRAREIPAGVRFSTGEDDEGDGEEPQLGGLHAAISALANQAYEDGAARREELTEYARQLAQYGIELEALADSAPKHVDARENAKQVARLIAADARLSAFLRERKQLPLRELEARSDMGRKSLERHRKYIIAITLILIGDFDQLHEYVSG